MDELRLECHKRLMRFSWKIIRLSRHNLNQMGFAWNQYTVMKNILPGEAVTLSELSSRAFKENSNVTALVDFLEEKGIVRRVNDKNDRRIIRVELTKEGVHIRQDIIERHEGFIEQLFKAVPDEDIKRFLQSLDAFERQL